MLFIRENKTNPIAITENPISIIILAPILSIRIPSTGPKAAPSTLLNKVPIDICVRDHLKLFCSTTNTTPIPLKTQSDMNVMRNTPASTTHQP